MNSFNLKIDKNATATELHNIVKCEHTKINVVTMYFI